MTTIPERPVILFDGICNLCNNAVQFIIKRDTKQHFLFASLQSDAGRKLLLQLNEDIYSIETIILIEEGKVYKKSTAALKISKHLRSCWKLLYAAMVIPRFLRDFVYNIIAKNRYKWFGKRATCMVPSAELKDRFL